MTILEANAACKANSARIMEVGKFSIPNLIGVLLIL